MIGGKIQGAEIVPFGFRFGTDRHREAQLAEDPDDLVDDPGHGVQGADPAAPAGHSEVEVLGAGPCALGKQLRVARRHGDLERLLDAG